MFGPGRVQLFRLLTLPPPPSPPPPTPEELRDLDPVQALGGRAFLDWRATTSRQQTSRVRTNEKPWRGSRHGRFISVENGETRKGRPAPLTPRPSVDLKLNQLVSSIRVFFLVFFRSFV